jgi:hypothetical protein
MLYAHEQFVCPRESTFPGSSAIVMNSSNNAIYRHVAIVKLVRVCYFGNPHTFIGVVTFLARCYQHEEWEASSYLLP